MDALILAAGLGTRLRPLTDDRPKALVTVGGRTLLEINITKLAGMGVHRIVVNVHHFADMVRHYLATHPWPCEVLVSDESNLLLDTGGALRKAAPLLTGDEVLVHNVDVLADFDLDALAGQHRRRGSLATLAVSRRNTGRLLLADDDGTLQGWHNNSTNETRWVNSPQTGLTAYAFSGITLIARKLLDLLPPANHPYPIVPEYLRLARTHRIDLFEHDPRQWLDVGKPETLARAAQFLERNT